MVVRFLLRRRRRARFRFIPLANLRGSRWEDEIRVQLDLDLKSSLVVWKNGELRARAQAVFAIFSELGWPWLLLGLLRIVPLSISNAVYDLYARHRYQILGKAKDPDICAVLPIEQRKLFQERPDTNLPIFPTRTDVFLSAQWQQLILINFAVPAEALDEYLPDGLELDDWQSEQLVSLVGFAFTGTSVAGMTLPVCCDFEEINLRFYVKRTVIEAGQKVVRRGVVFVREIVPFALIAKTANFFFGERYAQFPTCLERTLGDRSIQMQYSWSDEGRASSLWMEARGEAESLQAGSLSEFITEHYFGYAKRGQDNTVEYEVEHPRWRVWTDVEGRLQGDVLRFYPDSLTRHMKQVHSALMAEGSAIRVMRGRCCT